MKNNNKSAIVFFIGTLFSFGALVAQDITSDLIMDVSFSDEVVDLTENAIPILSGMETYVEDRNGNPHCAIRFNAQQDEFIQIPVNDDNGLVQGDDFTVSLWFKMGNVDIANSEYFFQKGLSNTEGFQMKVFDMNTPLISDRSFGMGIWDNDWNTDPDLHNDTENWHHFVMVVEGDEIRLYRDNELRNSYDEGDFHIESEYKDYYIGQFFEGDLDDIKVYKRVLNDTEIDMLYNQEGDCSTLMNTEEVSYNGVHIMQHSNKSIEIINLPEDVAQIEIVNLQGKKVWNVAAPQRNQHIDLSYLSGGVYILRIDYGGSYANYKFILQ